MDTKRCRKCKISGPSEGIDEHEKTCIALPCSRCEGRGYRLSPGCIRPQRFACMPCEQTGVTGGRKALNAAWVAATAAYAAAHPDGVAKDRAAA